MKKQSLKDILVSVAANPKSPVVLANLDGKRRGSDPETQAVLRQMEAALPLRGGRTYSLGELIDALYTVDAEGVYRRIGAAETPASDTCDYQCYVIGGPWVTVNPSCPTHGRG